jgi:hypothetical protein
VAANGPTPLSHRARATKIREPFRVQFPCTRYPQPVGQLHQNAIRGRIILGMTNLATPAESGRVQLLGQYLTALASTSFIPAAVIAKKDIGPGPKLVYSRLVTYAMTNEAATNNRLAADLGVSPRSIRNYLSALKAAGLVQVEHHPGKPRSFKLAATAQ